MAGRPASLGEPPVLSDDHADQKRIVNRLMRGGKNAGFTILSAGGNAPKANGNLLKVGGNSDCTHLHCLNVNVHRDFLGGNGVWTGGNRLNSGGNSVNVGRHRDFWGGNTVQAGGNSVWLGGNAVREGGNGLWLRLHSVWVELESL